VKCQIRHGLINAGGRRTCSPHGKNTILPNATESFTLLWVATLLETALDAVFPLVDGALD
jgi:hypothetical protein